jgi:hypothetical protein
LIYTILVTVESEDLPAAKDVAMKIRETDFDDAGDILEVYVVPASGKKNFVI